MQIVVAFGLINVWVFRFRRATPYRGGGSRSMPEEFAAYGLPAWSCYLVGGLKLLAAAALLIGLWVPAAVPPAAAALTGLMAVALAMHLKVGDPGRKSIPAAGMLLLNIAILSVSLGAPR